MLETAVGYKKILFVSPVGTMYGGAERSGLEFCRYLIKNGFHVETVLPATENEDYINELQKYDMKFHIAQYEFNNINNSFSLGIDTLVQTMSVVEIIEKSTPDVVISNMSSFVHGAVAAAITNTPHIWMERGNGYRIQEPHIKNILDFVFKYSNSIIVNSTGLKQIYEKHYKKSVTVVRSFTDEPKVGLNPNIEDRRIIVVSRLSPEKNITEILKAVNVLKDALQEKGIRTIIVGQDGGSRGEITEFIAQNKLSGIVEVLDYHPTPWALFGKNDIYVNSSIFESVGRSSVEAIRLGLITVLADIPGHQDIFKVAGSYKYKSGDHESLARVLLHVIEHSKEAKDNARKWSLLAKEGFSEESCNRDAVRAVARVIGQDNSSNIKDIFYTTIHNQLIAQQSASKRIEELERANGGIVNLGAVAAYKRVVLALRKKLRTRPPKGKNIKT